MAEGGRQESEACYVIALGRIFNLLWLIQHEKSRLQLLSKPFSKVPIDIYLYGLYAVCISPGPSRSRFQDRIVTLECVGYSSKCLLKVAAPALTGYFKTT